MADTPDPQETNWRIRAFAGVWLASIIGAAIAIGLPGILFALAFGFAWFDDAWVKGGHHG